MISFTWGISNISWYFKTFQTLHGRRVSAWLPSTSQWAPIESIQRPEQKRRKRLQVFVKKNPNSNNILHSILSYILILYLSLLIIAYYIALIVFKIKTSNFLYVFMYLLFTSQTHPLCLKSLLVSFSLLESLQKKEKQNSAAADFDFERSCNGPRCIRYMILCISC